jgi:hypothetical protein
MWKTIFLITCILSFLLVLTNCSTSKATNKPKPATKSDEGSLISAGEDAVQKRFGEPTTISRTSDGHILWIYEPTWKLMPDEKGTRYVEFDKGQVVKIFKIK